MNFLSVIFILCAVISFESAIAVYRIRRRSIVNILYFILTIDFTIHTVFFSQFLVAPSEEMADILARISGTFLAIQPALILHFTLSLTGKIRLARNPLFIAMMHSPGIYYTSEIYWGGFFTDFIQTRWGWDNIMNLNSFSAVSSFFYALSVLIVCIILIWQWKYHTEIYLEKKQGSIILISYSCGLISYIMNVMIATFLYDPIFYTLISALLYAFCILALLTGVRYAIVRYKLMIISPETAAMEIISGIKEPVFFLDPDGRILFQNRLAEEIVSDLSKKTTINEIFNIHDSFSNCIINLTSGINNKAVLNCAIVGNNGLQKIYKLRMKGIRNETGTLTGIVAIAGENPDVSGFQEKFRLTDRQLGIIYMVVAGQSNREISERLQLSERTVENHLFNIYNKIGINNRIELINLVIRYNILEN